MVDIKPKEEDLLRNMCEEFGFILANYYKLIDKGGEDEESIQILSG